MADVRANESQRAGERVAGDARSSSRPKVFINYRHEDTEEAAVRVHERLAARFGAENVFLDVKSVEPGTKWLTRIKEEGAKGSAFVALIGRTWLTSLKDHEQLLPGDPPDYVVLELEFALNKWPGRVIPVLVGRTTMPDAGKLPKPIRRLSSIQACTLRPLSFDEDLDAVVSKIDAVSDTSAASAPPAPLPPAPKPPSIAAPDSAHYGTVLSYMLEQGSVVPVLGSGVRGSLPDAEPLAAHLARVFRLPVGSPDLAAVAQRVAVSEGPSFLEKAIFEVLTPQPEPQDVHRFLARFPRRTREMGLPERPQMIVTANYDSALEQAFDDEEEDYDLAVFLANGTDADGSNRGRFLHIPAGKGDPEPIGDPGRYRAFKINRFDELERTLIVKIHGAAEGGEGALRWDGNYVLTEDQYIDYLVNDQVVRLVPYQILNKLKRSHCLFLGYAIHDWSLRVFLKRVWQGGPLRNNSWAIERLPDAVERDTWRALQVELLARSPDDYVGELEALMSSRASRRA